MWCKEWTFSINFSLLCSQCNKSIESAETEAGCLKTATQDMSEKCCLQQRAAGQTVPLKIREFASQDHHAYQPGQAGWYSVLENEGSLRPAEWEGVGVALLSNSVTFCGTHFLNKHWRRAHIRPGGQDRPLMDHTAYEVYFSVRIGLSCTLAVIGG